MGKKSKYSQATIVISNFTTITTSNSPANKTKNEDPQKTRKTEKKKSMGKTHTVEDEWSRTLNKSSLC